MSSAPVDHDDTFTVGELNRLIRYALSVTFPDEVWVQGEISGLRRHASSGNVYFQLVDAGAGASQPDATLSVSLPRGTKEGVNRLLKRANPQGTIRMADGVHIRIRGALEYYPPQGKLQLRMSGIDPAHTLGHLAAERDRVLAALAAEQLLDRNAARPFALLPLRVGLATSEGSAAHADFLDELRASGIGWRVTLVATRVQGQGADREIAAALRQLDRLGLDVVALVRGGGARTDLMAFDSEHLARTIAAMDTPVVAGVGHEIDTSVADQVAARAYKTPTACAVALIDAARSAIDRSEQAWADIARRSHRALDGEQQRLDVTGRHLAGATRHRLGSAVRSLDVAQQHLERSAERALAGAARRVDTAAARADAVDPARALARGWSITRTSTGRVVRHPDDVGAGDELVTTVAGGVLRSRVTEDPGTTEP